MVTETRLCVAKWCHLRLLKITIKIKEQSVKKAYRLDIHNYFYSIWIHYSVGKDLSMVKKIQECSNKMVFSRVYLWTYDSKHTKQGKSTKKTKNIWLIHNKTDTLWKIPAMQNNKWKWKLKYHLWLKENHWKSGCEIA